jgi:hypothetical protein
MDSNEAGLIGDDPVGGVQRRASARDRNGKNTLMTAKGAVGRETTLDHGEESPLLQDSGDDGERDDDDDDDRFGGSDNEWAGLPWYKRPSVRNSLAKFYAFGTDGAF